MVTRATVDKIISKEELSVIIHAYDIVEEGPDDSELSSTQTARISCPPGLIPEFKVGDIVFVCIEDNDLGVPVVMGKLILDDCSEENIGKSNAYLNTLNVSGSAKLSSSTSIGEVTQENIKCLKGVNKNIQDQLDFIFNDNINVMNTLATKLNNFAAKFD
jgi:hypothetical protein